MAQAELPYLQNLIRENCLEKCIAVDSGVKLDPDTVVEQKLIRIFEKLLLKKSAPKQPIHKSEQKQQREDREGIASAFKENMKEILGRQ